MAFGLVTEAICSSPCRPSLLPMSARVIRCKLVNGSRLVKCERRILFCDSAGESLSSPIESRMRRANGPRSSDLIDRQLHTVRIAPSLCDKDVLHQPSPVRVSAFKSRHGAEA